MREYKCKYCGCGQDSGCTSCPCHNIEFIDPKEANKHLDDIMREHGKLLIKLADGFTLVHQLEDTKHWACGEKIPEDYDNDYAGMRVNCPKCLKVMESWK